MSALAAAGRCDARFEPVREAFEEGLSEQEKGGGAVSVWVDGRAVVDLLGGSATITRPTSWRPTTLTCIHSATKGMAAVCVMLLVDRDEIDLERPVADYWPEFASAGKQGVTVRMLLGGLAGLVYPDSAPAESFFDHHEMARAMERQAPAWPPGTQGAYHSSTFPCLLDELVRRVTDRPLGRVFSEEIARPLELDAHFGVADGDLHRVAEIHAAGSPVLQALRAPGTKLARAWKPIPNDSEFFNSLECKKSGNAGAGYVTAAALATFYGALAVGGGVGGVRILSPAAVDILRTEQWSGVCGLLDLPLRMALGVFLNSEATPMGTNSSAFGHHGLGGSLGSADPDAGLGFAYVGNSLDGEARCRRLVDAVYSCV